MKHGEGPPGTAANIAGKEQRTAHNGEEDVSDIEREAWSRQGAGSFVRWWIAEFTGKRSVPSPEKRRRERFLLRALALLLLYAAVFAALAGMQFSM
jgi:hypothetical protein